MANLAILLVWRVLKKNIVLKQNNGGTVSTANEPDADILALADDEAREVLVFKMSVALGFDAPRAFVLCSMRAARDEDFGVQLVGRILRVHRTLQAKAAKGKLPDDLRYG